MSLFCKSMLKENEGVLRVDRRAFQSCAAEKREEFPPNVVEVLGTARVIKAAT